MIIDAHVHVMPPRLREQRDVIAAADPWFAACHPATARIATPDELLADMERAAIDRAVCFAWPFRDPALCAEANDYLAAVQRSRPDRFIAFATVNPAAPGAADELRRCARLGLRGVGEVNCDAHGLALEDAAMHALAEVSVELDLPWTLHCSEPVGHAYAGKGTVTPDRVARFAAAHDQLRIICAHLGGGLPFYAHMPEIAELCRRLWFDTAAGPFLYAPSAYRDVVELCGAQRLLFGSDYPLLEPQRYSAAFNDAGLSEQDVQDVMGGAVAGLLGL